MATGCKSPALTWTFEVAHWLGSRIPTIGVSRGRHNARFLAYAACWEESADSRLQAYRLTRLGNPAVFNNNFDLSILRIEPGAHAYLEDLVYNGHRNGPAGAGEALFVDRLEFADANAQLNLNGIHLYNGSRIGDSFQIIDIPVDV